MAGQISPSMMCADPFHLQEIINAFEAGGIEYLHMDIMDGHFVPNFTMGTDDCRLMKANTKIPLDLHLMIERPEEKIGWFPIGKGDYVSVHAESTPHLQRALAEIRKRGAKAMAAINPATPLSVLEYVLPDLDGILVMTVNPGFAGQKLVPQSLNKIRSLRKLLRETGYPQIEIEVDGNVSFENAKRMREAGADIFVAGTSSIFHREGTLEENLQKLRDAIR